MIKYLLIIVHLIFSLNCLAQFSSHEIKEIKSKLPKGVILEYDDVMGIIWVSSKGVNLSGGTTFPDDRRTFVKLYFGISKTDGIIKIKPLRIVNRIYNNGWIFFNKIYYLVGDKKDKKNGTTKTYQLEDNNTSRETKIGGWVTEKSDIVVNEDIRSFIDYVIESGKDVKVRFSGDEQYYEETSSGKSFVVDFQPLVNIYDKLKIDYQ